MITASWSAVRTTLLGGALFALVAHALLLAGRPVNHIWLPLCLAAAWLPGLAARRQGSRDATPAPRVRAPRWLTALTVIVTAVSTAAIGYGSVATPDRAWDGVVAWGMKTAALTSTPGLDQPYFADPAVLHHSPDYPLLQPLCIASLAQWFGEQPARSWFAALFLLYVVVGGLAAERHGRDRTVATTIALALATTPFFVNASSGGADSGYAEMFLTLALLTAAAALLLDDELLLGAAACVLPLVKPEGTVALLGLCAVCFVAARRGVWLAALAGGAIALSLWLPLQLQLGYREPSPWPSVGVAVLAVLAAGLRWLLDRRGIGARGRLGAAVALGAALIAAVAIAQPWFRAQQSTLLSHYLGALPRAIDRLGDLPAIFGGLLANGLRPNRLGLTFPALVLALWVAFRTRRAAQPPIGALGTLTAWLCLGLAAIVLAFLLSPEPDLDHHLKSSAMRLLAHWTGVAWLVTAVVWAHARSSPTAADRVS